jgi:hypothetical protein
MCCCRAFAFVLGSSSTSRSGLFAINTRGLTDPLSCTSIFNLSPLGTTRTFSMDAEDACDPKSLAVPGDTIIKNGNTNTNARGSCFHLFMNLSRMPNG